MSDRLPSSVLFACTRNAVRSPMAESYMKFLHGRNVFVDSAGVDTTEPVNPFVVQVMDEIGVDISRHNPKSIAGLTRQDSSFDILVAMSPAALDAAEAMARTRAIEVEYWPVQDPTTTEGTRDNVLQAFRAVRDEIIARIEARFPVARQGPDLDARG